MDERKHDFYERNMGKPVHLTTRDGTTLTGDILQYDRFLGHVILANSIQRDYHPDGNSKFVESPHEVEIDVGIINIRTESTKEDRLGRIIKYNEDLKKERNENLKDPGENGGLIIV